MKKAARSAFMTTAGKWSLGLAAIYPTYWYLKSPIRKLADSALKKIDDKVTDAANNPLKTFVVSWGVYYLALKAAGIECTFSKKWIDPFHMRLLLTFGGGLATPSMALVARKLLDDYKMQKLPDVPETGRKSVGAQTLPAERRSIDTQTLADDRFRSTGMRVGGRSLYDDPRSERLRDYRLDYYSPEAIRRREEERRMREERLAPPLLPGLEEEKDRLDGDIDRRRQ